MSLAFTLTGKSSILAVSYFPAVDLNDGDYELDLTNFETYYTILNVNSSDIINFTLTKMTRKLLFPKNRTNYRQVSETHNFKRYHEKENASQKWRWEPISVDNLRQQQYDEEWDQVRLSDKFQ